jgi:DNA-binding winged helix-turn-helix (wHTH) protein
VTKTPLPPQYFEHDVRRMTTGRNRTFYYINSGGFRHKIEPAAWRILEALWHARGRWCSVEELAAHACPDIRSSASVKVMIYRLRKPLALTPFEIVSGPPKRGYCLRDRNASVAAARRLETVGEPTRIRERDSSNVLRNGMANRDVSQGDSWAFFEHRTLAEIGCAYIVDEPVPHNCGAPLRVGSSYCRGHHRICHLAPGSKRESRKIAYIERLGASIGGKITFRQTSVLKH